jgi:ABC-type polysaccharide/polyol phosphate export permease
VWEGAVAVRRQAFEELGGWPEELFYFHEGIDLAWRALDAGWAVWYAGDVLALHPAAPAARHGDLFHYMGARNRIWLARRHLPLPLAVVYVAVWVLRTVARLRMRQVARPVLRGYADGLTKPCGGRRRLRWRTVWRMTVAAALRWSDPPRRGRCAARARRTSPADGPSRPPLPSPAMDLKTDSPSASERQVRAQAPSGAGAIREAPSPRPAREDEFTSERHVYRPHRVGLPPLLPYLRAVWRRRQFTFELARTKLRSQHYNTVFGQLWLVLNPVLLATVYFILVEILRARGSGGLTFFAHLMAGLFAFYFFSSAVNQGAKSVVGGGRLILNTAFPRTLLPLSSVVTAFMRFLPTLIVYAAMHAVAGLPVGPHLLWAIPIFAMIAVFAAGVAMLFAAAQVYFRDLSSFLPYVTRIWLYASPVLYYVEQVPERFKPILALNPLYPLLASWSDVLNQGQQPSATFLVWGLAWAVAALVVGGLFFMSREREFAVRL